MNTSAAFSQSHIFDLTVILTKKLLMDGLTMGNTLFLYGELRGARRALNCLRRVPHFLEGPQRVSNGLREPRKALGICHERLRGQDGRTDQLADRQTHLFINIRCVLASLQEASSVRWSVGRPIGIVKIGEKWIFMELREGTSFRSQGTSEGLRNASDELCVLIFC